MIGCVANLVLHTTPLSQSIENEMLVKVLTEGALDIIINQVSFLIPIFFFMLLLLHFFNIIVSRYLVDFVKKNGNRIVNYLYEIKVFFVVRNERKSLNLFKYRMLHTNILITLRCYILVLIMSLGGEGGCYSRWYVS